MFLLFQFFDFALTNLYAGYRFGEILDGHYEISATHGKGVFSAVVRAKDLKACDGELGDVAIKIIRNNETMLVIIKGLFIFSIDEQ